MSAWEYLECDETIKTVPVYGIIGFLNKKGKEGWELVTIIPRYFVNEPNVVCSNTFYFKRKTKPTRGNK